MRVSSVLPQRCPDGNLSSTSSYRLKLNFGRFVADSMEAVHIRRLKPPCVGRPMFRLVTTGSSR
jgi:hypothetical protein